jgi:hypothetical protein
MDVERQFRDIVNRWADRDEAPSSSVKVQYLWADFLFMWKQVSALRAEVQRLIELNDLAFARQHTAESQCRTLRDALELVEAKLVVLFTEKATLHDALELTRDALEGEQPALLGPGVDTLLAIVKTALR